MFGELLGLWAVDGWRTDGAPSPVALVELGPGRGTMMADALRAAAVDPAFTAAGHAPSIWSRPAPACRAPEGGAGYPPAALARILRLI